MILRSSLTTAFLAGAIVISQSAVNLASDKTPPPKEKKDEAAMRATGHHEVPHDPYIPTPRARQPKSPGAIVSRDGYVSVQVNVDEQGNNIVNDAANEPSLAVDPTDHTRMVIGWRQFDNIASDFRQAGYGYTSDGGQSWTFPGSIEPGVFRSDPVLDADAQGNFYYNSLTTDNPASPSDFWCHVFKSTDGGATWDAGTYAWGGDKQWQVIDTTDGIGQGNIYAAWNYIYSACSGDFTRSADNGASFDACSNMPGHPYWGTLAVGPDGELFVCGNASTVIRSTTMQDPAQPHAWDLTGTVNLGGSLEVSAGPNPGGLLGQTWIAVDHSNGPTRGNVYMLASVTPSGSSDPLDVRFARSTDGGATWSTSVRINDDSSTDAWQWFGTMSVAPNGRIDVIWLDTRNDPGGYDSELYYAYSTDAGVTWSPNEAVTPAFDPHVGWPQQNKMGDYFDMISDDLGADLAYAATFNGEQDVFYVRLGDPACPNPGLARLDGDRYACEDTVTVDVIDCGLNTDDELIEQVVVTLDSTSETGGEAMTLTETAPASGKFTGTLVISQTDASGVLWVAPGDTITVTYNDADDGTGNPAVVTDTAIVDCQAPVISNIHMSDVQPRSATVAFDADEPVKGTVYFGTACGALTESAAGGGFSESPTVGLAGLEDDTTYFYAVEAEDEAGNSVYDDNGGACYTFSTPEIPDFFTELFETDNDLDNRTLTFTPNGSVDYYRGCSEPITSLPVDPTGGTVVSLSDDDSELVTLTMGGVVSLYGTGYTSFYIGSNGFITFTSGNTDTSESLADHFDTPRISALFDDLDPTDGGTVSYKQLLDRVVVTYLNIREYSSSTTPDPNTFQIEMYFDGTIVISYLDIAATDGLAGLSAGNGVDPDFYETDLSTMDCDPAPPRAISKTVETPMSTPVTFDIEATDDGLPTGELTYYVTSLPTYTLKDAGNDYVITAGDLPYTPVGGGTTLTYEPIPNQNYTDSFQFQADDGGTPPQGGLSNIATVSIEVGGPQAVISVPMDTNPGWTTTGQWAFGQPTGGGSYSGDPTSGATGNNVYGYNLAGDYAHSISSPYYLTTPAFDLRGVTGCELRFQRWLGVEHSTYDHATLEISTDGASWVELWENPSGYGNSIDDGAWVPQSFDISGYADDQQTVYLRWGMGPTDGSVSYCGWNLDDVEIWGMLPITTCEMPGDVNDDGLVDGGDIQPFIACAVAGEATGECECADVAAPFSVITPADIDAFVGLLLGE